MNRCPERHEWANDVTRCWLDEHHPGDHKRWGDPQNPPVTWSNVGSMWARVTRRVLR